MISQNNLVRLLVIILIILGCIIMLGVVWGISQLPEWTSDLFGPPGKSSSISEQLLYSIRLINNKDALLLPLTTDPDSKETYAFTVDSGESVESIAFRLEEMGLIRNSEVFLLFLVYSGKDTGIQAGEFELNTMQNAVEIAAMLQDATPKSVQFVILPGWRMEEVIESLPYSGLAISPLDFENIVRTPPQEIIPAYWGNLPSLEGFLFPGSYKVERDCTVDELLAIILDRLNAHMTPGIIAGFEQNGLNVFQAINLASIVEREAVLDEENIIIASVFLNRLQIGMKLESDPTVQFSLGYDIRQMSWWKNALTSDDLAIDSPYNTYQYAGLPPGPICNPGFEAIKAVSEARAGEFSYLYFRARCDGSSSHNFADTYEEHLLNACP